MVGAERMIAVLEIQVTFADPHGQKMLGRGVMETSLLPRVGDKLVFTEEFCSESGVPIDYIWTVKHVVHNYNDERYEVWVMHSTSPHEWF